MENIKLGYMGRYNQESIFLNEHKTFGHYLNYKKKLYNVPKCFQNEKFNLETAIKIIDYKNNKEKEKKDDDDDEVEIIKKLDKKSSNH